MMVEKIIRPYRLEFRFPFRIAHGERTGTDAVFLVVRRNGFTGFGEATLPPYLGIKPVDVVEKLRHPLVDEALQCLNPQEAFKLLEPLLNDNRPALAAVDMALWQIYTLERGKSVAQLNGISTPENKVPHTYTIGVCSPEQMKARISWGVQAGFKHFKLKLDGHNDQSIIKRFRDLTDAPFAVDVNQAWTTQQQAEAVLAQLESAGCLLIEQPFHKADRILTAILAAQTAIPIVADEACQTPADLHYVMEFFDGVNVKLQKCGGITPALQMLDQLRRFGKRSLIGCMSESSVGCNAAEQLAGLCDWADLDGPWLNANNAALLDALEYEIFK